MLQCLGFAHNLICTFFYQSILSIFPAQDSLHHHVMACVYDFLCDLDALQLLPFLICEILPPYTKILAFCLEQIVCFEDTISPLFASRKCDAILHESSLLSPFLMRPLLYGFSPTLQKIRMIKIIIYSKTPN